MTYSIAIRTLGLSGDKFRRELESITRQTVSPERVMVYIAEGYVRPDFQIGKEEYVWVPKGMVRQRALQYEEITSDCIMLLDDDVELAPESAAILLQAMEGNQADVVGADTFRNQDMSWRGKIFAALTNWVLPHRDQNWAFKVKSHGGFSYLAHPTKDCYPSQSCAGPASLWRKEVLLALQLRDEAFLDHLGFSFGDDFLEFYKIHQNGYRLYIHYNCGIEHLDAKSSSAGYHSNVNKFYVRSKGSFILWWRGCYETSRHRCAIALVYLLKTLWLLFVNIAAAVWARNARVVWLYIKGLIDGWKYMHSGCYAEIPGFILRKSRPRLLHVITSLRTGGAEKLMVDLLPRLREQEYEVDLCVFNGVHTPFYEQLERAGIRVIPFSARGSVYNPLHIYRLWKLMRRYDIVHTHNTSPQMFAAIGSVLCSVALVTTEHTTSNRRRRWKWYACVDRWMYSRYSYIISISDATEANLRDFIGEQTDKITTIYNGIDVHKYATAQAVDRVAITSHPERMIVSMVAGFRYQKDQETVIRALKHLPDSYELWLIGDGDRRPIIEDYIKENRVEDNVRLLGIRADIPEILKASDIVVMSSHWEGFGLAAVEGMAAGKPVIASDIEGVAQVVKGAGILFEHANDKELSEKIGFLSNDSEYYNEVSAKCSARATQYDIQKMVDGYVHVYSLLSLKKF